MLVYATYRCTLLPLSLMYFLMPMSDILSQHDPISLVFSFVLLPCPVHSNPGVAWRLVFEITFYPILAMAIVRGRGPSILLVVYGIFVLSSNIGFAPLSFPNLRLGDVDNIELLIGAGAAAILRGAIILNLDFTLSLDVFCLRGRCQLPTLCWS